MKRSYDLIEPDNSVIIFEDERCNDHIPSSTSIEWKLPECPERTQVISAVLKEQSFTSLLKFVTPNPVTSEELLTIVDPKHYYIVQNTIDNIKEIPAIYQNDPDVVLTKGSQLAACLAAGAVKDAVHMIIKPNGYKKAFCNMRPPGHHATCKKASGFCLYNNVWFGVQEARKIMKLNYPNSSFPENVEPRIAIIDWDLHHGDGTEDYVRRNAKLPTFFVSIHQDYKNNYPGTGREKHIQIQNSTIICHNIPIGGGDSEIHSYFKQDLIPELQKWKPDFIFISCGFDAHHLDPVGKLSYSSQLYGWMTKQIVKVADEHCGGRIISVLEGGYNLQALRESAVEHVKALLNL